MSADDWEVNVTGACRSLFFTFSAGVRASGPAARSTTVPAESVARHAPGAASVAFFAPSKSSTRTRVTGAGPSAVPR